MSTSPVKLDLSQYTAVQANNDQIIQHARAAHVPWHNGATWENFLAANYRERQQPWAINGGLTVWVLVKRDDPSGEVYAGCELYRRQALIAPGQSDSAVENGWIYAIASVLTPVQHLRKGYATHLLRLLHYQLADRTHLPPFPPQWGDLPPKADLPPAVASILWSDIGSEFYRRCTIGADIPGWVTRPEYLTELTWPILDTPGTAEGWEYIYPQDMAAVGRRLSDAVRKEMLGNTSSSSSSPLASPPCTVARTDPASTGALSFLPDRGAILSAKKPGPHEPCGVRYLLNGKSDGVDETIVLFTGYNDHIPPPRFLISYIHNLQPHHLPGLLAVLDPLAARAGRDEACLWGLDLSSELVQAWKKARSGTRAGVREGNGAHLLGVAWYGPEPGEYQDWQMWTWC